MARWPRPFPTFLRLLAIAACCAPGILHAAGFEYPVQGTHALGRGGAFTASADDPSAMYWNPGRLALLRGTRLLINENLVDLSATFHRAPQLHEGEWLSWDAVDEQEGFFALGVSAFVTSDFGLEDWAFGLGFVGPTAIGTSSFAGGPDSATRYAFIEKDMLMAYYTASVAWKYEEWFGIGVSLQYVDLMQMKYSLVIEGPSTTGGRPDNNLWDIRNTLDMKDRAGFTAIVGAWARPLPWLEIGASARVVPIAIDADGTIRLEGTSNSILSEADPEDLGGSIEFTMPATFQFGVRYVHRDPADHDREVFDVEVDVVWEQWSVLDAYDVSFAAEGATFEDPEDPSRILLEFQPQDFRLVRDYQDTWSVRLGGQWNVLPDHLWLRLGGLWESAAAKHDWTMLDFATWDRLGVAFGLSGRLHGVELSFAYAHIFLLPRNVYPDEAAVPALRLDPDFSGEIIDGPTVNAGRYEGGYDVISIGVEIHWDTLLGGGEDE